LRRGVKENTGLADEALKPGEDSTFYLARPQREVIWPRCTHCLQSTNEVFDRERGIANVGWLRMAGSGDDV
jgi:hypothetical protein